MFIRNFIIATFMLLSSVSFSQTTPAFNIENNDTIYTIPEKMAEFPGGDDAMMKYLINNIKYPAKMREQNIQGKVFISFVVSERGQISNIRTLHAPHQDLADEAIRVISGMPEWIPAMQDGRPVKMQFNLPINFTLKNSGQSDSTAIRKYALYTEGKALYDNKQYEKAALKLEECIALGPVGDAVIILCAQCYLELNNTSKACECLSRVSDKEAKTARKLMNKHCSM